MATNMIYTIEGRFIPTGTQQAAAAVDNVRNRIQELQKAGSGMSATFNDMKRVLVGTALALPLAGFVKEAIRSEEITARFKAQVLSLGGDFESLTPIIDAATKRVRELAGVTQTELIQALTSGLRFFKDVGTEMSLLNTAMGMTKVTGVSLAGAFQQLGYIQMGMTRAARYYGVSMHTEIKDKTERAAAIIADMTKKMEPLAKQTGTTAEQLKIMGATVKDLGERVGADLLPPIGFIAKEFNKMNEDLKELIITEALFTGATVGMITGVKVLTGALGGLAGAKAAVTIANTSSSLMDTVAKLEAATAKTNAFKIALANLPLEIWIGGITAAATALYFVIKKTNDEFLKMGAAQIADINHRAAAIEAVNTYTEINISKEDDLKAAYADTKKTVVELTTAMGMASEANNDALYNQIKLMQRSAVGQLQAIKDTEAFREKAGYKTIDDLDKKLLGAEAGDKAVKMKNIEDLSTLASEKLKGNLTEKLKAEEYFLAERMKIVEDEYKKTYDIAKKTFEEELKSVKDIVEKEVAVRKEATAEEVADIQSKIATLKNQLPELTGVLHDLTKAQIEGLERELTVVKKAGAEEVASIEKAAHKKDADDRRNLEFKIQELKFNNIKDEEQKRLALIDLTLRRELASLEGLEAASVGLRTAMVEKAEKEAEDIRAESLKKGMLKEIELMKLTKDQRKASDVEEAQARALLFGKTTGWTLPHIGVGAGGVAEKMSSGGLRALSDINKMDEKHRDAVLKALTETEAGQKWIEEHAHKSVVIADQLSGKYTDIATVQAKIALDKAKEMQEEREKALMQVQGAAGRAVEKRQIEDALAKDKQRTAEAQDRYNLLIKTAEDIDKIEAIVNPAKAIKPEIMAQLNATNNWNITITPSVKFFKDALLEEVGRQVEKYIAGWFDDFHKLMSLGQPK